MEFEAFTDKFEGFIGTNFWTMIFAWVNLLILYLLFKKYLFGPIKKMIDSRQKEIDDMFTDAENSKADAAELKSNYEKKLEQATAESDEIVKKAVRKAQLKEEEILKDAEEKASLRLAQAEEQIVQEKKQALNDIKDEVGDIAINIAKTIIEKDVSADEHSALIDDFISKIGED